MSAPAGARLQASTTIAVASLLLAASDFIALLVAFNAEAVLLPPRRFLLQVLIAVLTVCTAGVVVQGVARRISARWQVSWSFTTVLGVQLGAVAWGAVILAILRSAIRFNLLETIAAVGLFQLPVNVLAVGLAMLMARRDSRLVEPS